MANRRVLLKRRKASGNIRKITRTMQLIATAKYQQAYTRAVASHPYTRKLGQLVADISRAAGDVEHPLMRVPEVDERSALVAITSDRGLCGGYNINVLREAGEHLEGLREKGVESELLVAGRKGMSFLRFQGQEISEELHELGDAPSFEQVEQLADSLMDRFVAGDLTSVHVAFMKFISTGRQVPTVVQLLPLEPEGSSEVAEESQAAASNVEYEFSPDPAELLAELLPATFRVLLFQAFMDASVSEQVARMVAMKAATEAAEDMIKRLTQQYNRARQTQITMELLDIVGGANALA
jgi:F-type H+-transporting ATPase subunit gamma